ncbi:hypothetical protein [Verticiella sediminum]|nr:hypothetical protein [Verticiella sediminum]
MIVRHPRLQGRRKAPRSMRGLTILQLMSVLAGLGIAAWLVLTYLQR